MLQFLTHINQAGGAKVAKKSGRFPWIAFILSFVMLFIKALLVQWSYNYVMPRVFVSMGGNPQAFRELTLMDAFALVILIGSLW